MLALFYIVLILVGGLVAGTVADLIELFIW